MNTLRRWTSGIISSVDWMITQVENHEGLVNSAIDDMQRSASKAKVQLARVSQDGKKMRARLVELKEKGELWKERAVATAKADEKRALECLKRHKRTVREIKSTEEQIIEHGRVEKQLTSDLSTIEERLGQLKVQRNLLKTRQSRAEALKVFQSNDTHLISEIGDIFERWETKVGEYELQGNCGFSTEDELEGEYVSSEEEAELRATLSQLLENKSE